MNPLTLIKIHKILVGTPFANPFCTTVHPTVHLASSLPQHVILWLLVVIRKCSVKILLPITAGRSKRHKHATLLWQRGIIIISIACHTVDGQQNAVIYILIRSTFRAHFDSISGTPLSGQATSPFSLSACSSCCLMYIKMLIRHFPENPRKKYRKRRRMSRRINRRRASYKGNKRGMAHKTWY